MHQDEGDRISWARDGKRGAPLVLFYLPVADPDAHGAPDYDQIPSLILVADSGAGIGGGGGESSAAVPHLEALLAQLPLGLAMADRVRDRHPSAVGGGARSVPPPSIRRVLWS